MNVEMCALLGEFTVKDLHSDGTLVPAIKKNDSGYSIRVILSTKTFYNGDVEQTFGYFELGNDGIIFKTPRGHSSKWKSCRVIDIDDYCNNRYNAKKTILKKKILK